MTKSGIVIASALMTFGLAASVMAADMPKIAAPMSVDAPAATNMTVSTKSKKHKKHKKAAPSTAT